MVWNMDLKMLFPNGLEYGCVNIINI